MRHKSLFAVVAVILAVMAPSILASYQAPKKRIVTLSIVLAAGPKNAQVMTLEGEMGVVGIKDVGQFGFTPSFKNGDDKNVVVTVFDASTKPATELGKVDVAVGAKAVSTKTKPSFDIQVLSVVQGK